MLENKKGLAGLLAKAADGAETLGGKLAGLEAKLAKLLDDQAAWQANSGKANGRQGAQEFVTNGETTKLKVHCVGSDGLDFPPHLWRAKCGFRFAFCGFTRHSSLKHFSYEEKCNKRSGKAAELQLGICSSSATSEEGHCNWWMSDAESPG